MKYEGDAAPLDDSGVEITDLRQGTSSPGFTSPNWPRFTPHQRKISLVATTLAILLAISILLASMSDVRMLLSRTLFPARSSNASDSRPLYLVGNPSWGRFTLDGTPITHLPVIGQDKPLTLAPGAHHITWRAEPFHTQDCILIIGSSSTVSGSCAHSNTISMGYPSPVSPLVVSFFASLNELSPEQHTSLVRQIQATLDMYGGSATVHPGEVYAVSEQEIQAHPSLCPIVVRITLCYAHASQPLTAMLHIRLDASLTPGDPCIVSGQCLLNRTDCRTLCPDLPVVFSNQSAEGWNVLAVIRMLWSYTTPSGTIVASDQPDSAIRGLGSYQLLSLRIIRDSQGWHISPFSYIVNSAYNDPLCSQATQDTTELVNTLTNTNQSVVIQQVSDLHNDLASGCLEVARSAPGVFGTPTPTPAIQGSTAAYCLLSFGVILAANNVAHQLWPYMPVADFYERSVAQRLYSSLPL